MTLDKVVERTYIGEGRAATAFLETWESGAQTVAKIFNKNKVNSPSDFLTTASHYIAFGAPNAYTWNEDAVLCAKYRRDILGPLLNLWFDGEVEIAKALDVFWDEEIQAYALRTEFIEGRHVSLHHPFSSEREYELPQQQDRMQKLRGLLFHAGVDGLLHQLGLANPNALPNCMIVSDNECKNLGDLIDIPAPETKTVIVDGESGVSPLCLHIVSPVYGLAPVFSHYLPLSIKHGRPLFDDVDIDTLSGYVLENKDDLIAKSGEQVYIKLMQDVMKLSHHQHRWKNLRRVDNSIQSNLAKGKITEEQAEHYLVNPAKWYLREALRVGWKAIKKASELPTDILWWAADNVTSYLNFSTVKGAAKFVISEDTRTDVAKEYCAERIEVWKQRKQLTDEESVFLESNLERTRSPYLTDFAAHMCLKPIEAVAFPTVAGALYASGVVDEWAAVNLVFWGGSITRTAYTLGKMAYFNLKSKHRDVNQESPTDEPQGIVSKILGIPYVIALGTGWIPSYGNTAFLNQMVYSATETKELGKFLIYDFFSRLGKKVPIWGGEDGALEHKCNNVPSFVFKNRQPVEQHY